MLSRLGALAASSAEGITATDAAASLAPGGSYIELDPDGALNALVAHAPAGPDRRQTDPAMTLRIDAASVAGRPVYFKIISEIAALDTTKPSRDMNATRRRR